MSAMSSYLFERLPCDELEDSHEILLSFLGNFWWGPRSGSYEKLPGQTSLRKKNQRRHNSLDYQVKIFRLSSGISSICYDWPWTRAPSSRLKRVSILIFAASRTRRLKQDIPLEANKSPSHTCSHRLNDQLTPIPAPIPEIYKRNKISKNDKNHTTS